MRYEEYSYLWPPRPGKRQAITRTRLAERERLGAWATIKKQGTSNVLHVSPDRHVKAVNRHKGDHKLWAPIPQTHMTFRHLPGTGWYVFCAELMHSKVAGTANTSTGAPLRNINYIHDILVADGDYLVGMTYADRQVLLRQLFPDTVEPLRGVGYRVIDPYTWLAVNFMPNPAKPGFDRLFASLTLPEDEGLVLKMPDARLQFCHKEDANDAWQFKCRRPSGNLAH